MRVFENCVIYLASFFPIARKLLNFFSVRHFSRLKILNFLIWDETSKLRQQSVEIVKVGPKRELRRQSVVFGVQRCLIWRSKPCTRFSPSGGTSLNWWTGLNTKNSTKRRRTRFTPSDETPLNPKNNWLPSQLEFWSNFCNFYWLVSQLGRLISD